MSHRRRPAQSRPAEAQAIAVAAPARPLVGVRLRPSRWRSLITRRRAVQALVGAALYWAIGPGGVPLTWVILGGSAAGVLLGKFFCRWMCPMGAVMELVTGRGGDSAQRHYLYFKLGCPIAWAGGLLNRLSLWRVKLRPERCTGCERCDEVCYVSQLAEGRSLHVAGQVNASTDYTCSRCLSCVAACPTGALTVGLVGRRAVPAGARARPPRPRSPSAPSRT